jgi:hypothetical protein
LVDAVAGAAYTGAIGKAMLNAKADAAHKILRLRITMPLSILLRANLSACRDRTDSVTIASPRETCQCPINGR